jgi:hypothetical protein
LLLMELGDYLSIPSSSDFELGTGDFTVECFVNFNDVTSNSGYSGIVNRHSLSGGTGWGLWNQASKFGFWMGAATTQVNSSETITTGKWYHIAAVRSGSTVTLYVDGIVKASVTNSSFTDTSSQPLGIGVANVNAGWNAEYGVNGYIQDLRIYKGLAKYTQNFIPASTDPDILPDTPSGVAYSSNVTAITDGAVAFDGSGDYLSISDGSDLELGNGDFTIEGYYYFKNTGSSGTNFWGKWASTPGRSYAFSYVKSSGKYIFVYSTNGTDETLSAEFVSPADIDRWVHFAAVRSGTSLKVYRDGKEIIDYNISTTTIYNSSANLLIGRLESNSNYDFNGFVSNFRLVKGTALYTSNFTPPSAPLTAVQNTKLLCCQSNVTSGAAAVSPNISGINDGTVWSSIVTGPTRKEDRVANAFNGSTSGPGAIAAYPGTLTFAPGLSSISSVRIYGYHAGSGVTLTVNGAAQSPSSGSAFDITISTSTLDSIVWTAVDGFNYMRIDAIVVDGTTLIDPVVGPDDSNEAATNFNPFTVNINTVRGQESGYATLNPLFPNPNGGTYSNGNLRIATAAGNGHYRANVGMSTGKWYWETVPVSGATPGIHGIGNDSVLPSQNPGQSTGSFGYYSVTGYKQTSGTDAAYGSTYTYGDVIGCAYDATNGKIYWSKNGVWQGGGDPVVGTNAAFTSVTNTPYYPLFCAGSGTSVKSPSSSHHQQVSNH